MVTTKEGRRFTGRRQIRTWPSRSFYYCGYYQGHHHATGLGINDCTSDRPSQILPLNGRWRNGLFRQLPIANLLLTRSRRCCDTYKKYCGSKMFETEQKPKYDNNIVVFSESNRNRKWLDMVAVWQGNVTSCSHTQEISSGTHLFDQSICRKRLLEQSDATHRKPNKDATSISFSGSNRWITVSDQL